MEHTGNTKTLKEIKEFGHFGEEPIQEDVKNVLFVDIETTGLDYKSDEITELNYALVQFGLEGEFYKVLYKSTQYQEPTKEISEDVTLLTAHTKESLKGQSIDKETLKSILDKTDFVVSWNSSFDRMFLEKLMPEFKNKFWGSAFEEIPWVRLFHFSGSLELLGYKILEAYGEPLDVLVSLMNHRLPKGKTLFYVLLKMCSQKQSRIITNTPFNKKDVVKNLGFYWNGANWCIDVLDATECINKLNNLGIEYEVQEINGFNKYRS